MAKLDESKTRKPKPKKPPRQLNAPRINAPQSAKTGEEKPLTPPKTPAPPPAILAVARDLGLKLVERRAVSAASLPEALRELAAAGKAIVETEPVIPGLPLLRLAGTLTAGQIDKGWIGKPSACAEKLADSARMVKLAAELLGPDKAKAALPLALSLLLKLIDTNGANPANLEAVFLDLAKTFGELA